MAEHNYDLKFTVDPKLYMCADTFMPYYSCKAEIDIKLDGQHDGHLWPQEFVDKEESALLDLVLEKLKPQLAEFIKKSRPFSIHGPF
jgi:hypothetical protein